MSRAVLSIGANLGDRLSRLQGVLDRLADRVVAVSGVYLTEPWGPVAQEDFLNAVVLVEDRVYTGADWLRFAQEAEQAAGRERRQRWGPRTLDVDIIWCAQHTAAGWVPQRSTDPELILPHPRADQRAFVLIPWLEVEPEAVLTVAGRDRPVRELVAELPPEQRAGVRASPWSLLVRRGER